MRFTTTFRASTVENYFQLLTKSHSKTRLLESLLMAQTASHLSEIKYYDKGLVIVMDGINNAHLPIFCPKAEFRVSRWPLESQ